jgi:hypothetical protein
LVAEAAQLSVAALKRQKWVILDAQDFKQVIFKIRTKRTKQIHEYYLSLERLMVMYAEYTYHFILRKERERSSQEIDHLIKMMEDLKYEEEQDRLRYEAEREEDRLRYQA